MSGDGVAIAMHVACRAASLFSIKAVIGGSGMHRIVPIDFLRAAFSRVNLLAAALWLILEVTVAFALPTAAQSSCNASNAVATVQGDKETTDGSSADLSSTPVELPEAGGVGGSSGLDSSPASGLSDNFTKQIEPATDSKGNGTVETPTVVQDASGQDSGNRPIKYWGNNFSNKFHRPSCPFAKSMNARHVVFFHFRREAIESGQLPCRYCLPPFVKRVECKILPRAG